MMKNVIVNPGILKKMEHVKNVILNVKYVQEQLINVVHVMMLLIE